MNLNDILKDYENETIDGDILDLIDAILTWETQSPKIKQTPIEHIPIKINNNPFDQKTKKRPKIVETNDTDNTTSLIAETLAILNLAFRIDAADNNKQQNEIIKSAELLAEKLRKKITNHIVNLQNNIQQTKAIIENYESQQNELTAINNTKKELEDLSLQKRNELAELKTHAKTIENEIKNIEREITIIKTNEQNLIENKKIIAEKKILLKTKAIEIKKEKELLENQSNRLDNINSNLQIKKSQQNELEAKIEQTKNKLKFTNNLIEQLKNDPLTDPAINAQIQAIWQLLPKDKIDNP
jgi:DNA repair exonuclease SbcCD ATPase subunit